MHLATRVKPERRPHWAHTATQSLRPPGTPTGHPQPVPVALLPRAPPPREAPEVPPSRGSGLPSAAGAAFPDGGGAAGRENQPAAGRRGKAGGGAGREGGAAWERPPPPPAFERATQGAGRDSKANGCPPATFPRPGRWGFPPPAQGRGNGVWAPVQPADLRLGEGADGPPARPGLPGTWGHRSLGAEPALMPLGPLTHSHQAHPGAGTPSLGAFQSRERAPKSRRAAVLPRPGRRPGGLPGKSDISQAWGGWEHGKWLVCAGRWRCQGHGLRAGPGVSWPFPLPSLPRATESG